MRKIVLNAKTGEILKNESSPFKRFLQVNRDELGSLDKLIKLSPPAARVYLLLWSKMNKYNDIACTYSKIQKELNISKTALTRAIGVLKKHNYILAKKVGSGNFYTVNGKIVWGSWGTNYKLCKFVAPIVISYNANEVEEDI